MKLKLLGIVLFVYFFAAGSAAAQPYLSRLTAAAGDPLYTTYAAALERSEFIVDEGYHLKWYDPQSGINFENEQAGRLCLGFKLNNEFRYFLNQMSAAPVITTSYGDLVKYSFYPFTDIRAEIFFLVYSSRIAIQDVKIINEGSDAAALDVYPFLEKNDRLTAASVIPGMDGLSFRHEEPPDNWTVSHGVPFEENLQNVFMINDSMDGWGGYSDLGALKKSKNLLSRQMKEGYAENTRPGSNSNGQARQNYCVEWGLVHHSDGSLCNHTPPLAQQIILLNGSDQEILTEAAPKWGDPDPNIPGNGFQGCELGNFDNPAISPGDSFTVIFTCLALGEQGTGSTAVPLNLPAPGGVNLDIQLSQAPFPPLPQNVQAQFLSGDTALIQWQQQPGMNYSIYKREAVQDTGEYNLLVQGITDSLWFDITVNSNGQYGYLVAARNAAGDYSPHSAEAAVPVPLPFFNDVQNNRLSRIITAGNIKVAALQKKYMLQPGATASMRIIRGVIEDSGNLSDLIQQSRDLMNLNPEQFIIADELLYSKIPELAFNDADEEMMYWSAFSMMRQCMLPPEGQCSYNYYVFSREPTWGWGHGGQVFHESLAMLACVFMDSISAMNSQRVYMERQWSDGYINYRTGPYLNETIPYNNQLTSSAPWFSWENWELYQIARDTLFLNEAYLSGKKFYHYWLNNRDADNDGLSEWGAHAVLESVRDGQVAVWDQVGWPSNFECLDLNAMLVNEARSLARMAGELGLFTEQLYWNQEAENRSQLINQYMWDEQSGFYYHVDRNDHDFSFSSPDDLKRRELIGFLPLWAGIATPQQAAQLLQHLSDPAQFWRDYGIPSLAADDGYYNPMGYWNGPVWVEWQYLIFRGLLRYGFVNEAQQLMEKVLSNVIYQLKTNHNFWELYSPDALQAGHHKTYIWSGLAARMLIDMQNIPSPIKAAAESPLPDRFSVSPNFPNPFNPVTRIRYLLPAAAQVEVIVCNALGQEIRTLVSEKQTAGEYRVSWNGCNESGQPQGSGVYFFRIRAGENYAAGKMLLLR
ncbi:MAG: trehalase family glycosidase [Calditrichia bacterium]